MKKKYRKFSGDEVCRDNFFEIVKTFQIPIDRFVFKFSRYKRGDYCEEDIRQECYVIMLEAIDRYDEDKKASFAPYLFNKLHWGLLKYVQSRSPHKKSNGGTRTYYPQPFSIEELDEEHPCLMSLPDNELEILEGYNQVVLAINTLPINIRDVAQMTWIEEMSIDNITFLTGLKKTEILKQLKQAREIIAVDLLIDSKEH